MDEMCCLWGEDSYREWGHRRPPPIAKAKVPTPEDMTKDKVKGRKM